MKISKLVPIAAFAAMACIPSMADAKQIEFTYNPNGEEAMGYGFGKKETYDVAIRINEPSMVGAKVTGFSVAVPVTTDVNEYSAWLTTELLLQSKLNVPNICSQAATPANGMLTVNFDSPYTITEAGVYVGYSFTVTDITDEYCENPIAVVEGTNADGLYVHASRSILKWMSRVPQTGANSAMVVYVDGDFAENSASASMESIIYGEAGKTTPITVSVANHGTAPISSIDYSYQIGDAAPVSASHSFDTPVKAVWGASESFEASVEMPAEGGSADFTITIDKVNGVDNKDIAPSAKASLKVLSFIPVNRPLVEEYTGMWCGACPVGYIALETLNEQYPKRFIAAAYHNGDDLETIAYSECPTVVSGYPSSYINRETYYYPYDLIEDWYPEACKFTPGEIAVEVEWADADHTKIKATSTSRFAYDYSDARFGVSYILIEDGMSNPTWGQSNYLSGHVGLYEGKDAELFTNGGSTVYGLVFNDVVIAQSGVAPEEGSIPSAFKAGEELEHSYTFDVSDVKNSYGSDVIINKDNLRVIAVIINKSTGNVVNSNSSNYVDGSEYASIIPVSVGEATVTSTVYYDLQGRRIENPSAGVFIKADVLSNGKVRTSKVKM